jgi:hypothetical protein
MTRPEREKGKKRKGGKRGKKKSGKTTQQYTDGREGARRLSRLAAP